MRALPSRARPRRAPIGLVLALALGSALTLAALSPRSAAAEEEDLEWDPIEPVNRALFAVNEGLDRVLVEPAARGWRFVLREPGLRAVDRFFTNLEFPIRLVGNLLQLRPVRAGEETGRFLVNTTIGVLGFFDPASSLGIGLYEEDVGQAFGSWGVPAGPYLMLPLLGPSGGRDLLTCFAYSALLGPASIARSTLGALNTRAQLIEEIEEAKLASLDYYSFVRNAYVTTRQALVEDRDPAEDTPEVDDDLYDLDGEE